ncbi:NADP-dependent 3-hydroxy acid dehydrogenase YdfG [Rhodococcus sp. SMB37]|uniref:short-chain dehydrogenase/reductase n=1 Tax=Rhodococcus sp. SMB37 TaxID=2512213 RepID=UPI00104F5FBB|nr:short-chain dehydrogenase/reductase [Rhodococcus sp. SMB37]TCN49744.1 NADP-dependent 3-hydroxy acid dehydrogenase YdfG [Rhodococcus sp. SMB37]
MTRSLNLAGRVALVTGAAQGIGLSMARELLGRGARVVLVDRDEITLKRAAETLDANATFVAVADVTDRDAMADVLARSSEDFGPIDVVVANAGITPLPATIRTSNLAEFDRVMAVNLTGALNTIHPTLDGIVERGGHIVVVSSAAAFSPGLGGSAYMASKAAVEQVGRALRLELAHTGATVTVAYYGFVDTELARNTLDRDPLGARVGELLPWPMNRRVSPERAAAVTVRAIERRAPRVVTPRLWAVYSALRGIVNPLIDEWIVRNRTVHTLVDDLERREPIDP